MNVRQMRKDFSQPDNCYISGVHQKFASGGPHLFAAHPEEICRRKKLFEGAYELSAIGVARGLSGREKELAVRAKSEVGNPVVVLQFRADLLSVQRIPNERGTRRFLIVPAAAVKK